MSAQSLLVLPVDSRAYLLSRDDDAVQGKLAGCPASCAPTFSLDAGFTEGGRLVDCEKTVVLEQVIFVVVVKCLGGKVYATYTHARGTRRQAESLQKTNEGVCIRKSL